MSTKTLSEVGDINCSCVVVSASLKLEHNILFPTYWYRSTMTWQRDHLGGWMRDGTNHFLLSTRRDAAAAKRFFRKAIAQPHTVNPRTITVDKNPGYPRAAADLKRLGELWRFSRLRQCKYLNNIVEQDHRRIKRLVRPALGFGSLRTVRHTLAGYEVMAMIRKGQVQNIGGRDMKAQGGFRCRPVPGRCLTLSSPGGRLNWAYGVYLQARMEPQAECMLVLIGATPEGKKELLGFQVGKRESAQSWRELLVDLKARGLTIASELATGDGALGFWKALDEVSPTTRHQRCTVHKTANVLDKGPLSVQPTAKSDLREIWKAPDRATAEAAIATFADKYKSKYDKAVTCLVKDRDALLTFYDFPAEHSHDRRQCRFPSDIRRDRHRA